MNAFALCVVIILSVQFAVFLIVKSCFAPFTLHQFDAVLFVVLGEENLSVGPKRARLALNVVVFAAVAFVEVLHQSGFQLEHVRATGHLAEEVAAVAQSVVVTQLHPVLDGNVAQTTLDPSVLPPVVGHTLHLLEVFDRRLTNLTQQLHAHHVVSVKQVRDILFNQT